MLFFKRAAPAAKPPEKYAAAAEDPSSIGNILLKMGVITPDQLRKAIGQKIKFDEALLGTLLKQLGYVNGKDIATALKIQNEMREGSALNAELDVLQLKMDESASRAKQLAGCISDARMRRRERGEKSGVFLIPTRPMARAGG
jgi:hypothetical protein